MGEFEAAWVTAVAEAERRARQSGRGDVADYLALRASNDLARATAVQWLRDCLMESAGVANRQGMSIAVESLDGHRFALGATTMVGQLLTLKSGVRKLSLESGWPRSPGDGIMRHGGLASARLRHMGLRAHDEELLLLRTPDGNPHWFGETKDGTRVPFQEVRIRWHLKVLVGPA